MAETKTTKAKSGRPAKKPETKIVEASEKEKVVIKEEQEAPAPAPVKEERVYTRDEVDAIVREALAKVQSNVVQVQATTPTVKLRFQCECSDQNVIQFGLNGKFGQITGKSGTFSVPKEAFGGEFRDELVQNLLASRELIVLDGLTDEERELYGVSYRDGEILDEKFFRKLTSMGDELINVYQELCDAHKIMVARRFMEEFEKNPKSINRNMILKLNEISKKEYANLPDGDLRKRGAFYPLLEAMNKRDMES